MTNVNFQNPLSNYEVAGYKPGDRIGGGVVVDPASLKKDEIKDTKLVTVDLNMNGKVDAQDDQVMVKLPPKGYVPADWKGPASWSFGDKAADGFFPAAGGVIGGGVVGLFSGFGLAAAAEGSVFGAKMVSNAVQGRFLAGAIAVGIIGGAIVGYKMSTGSTVVSDQRKARESAVPDMVQPKFILNQYLNQQPKTN